MNDITNIEQDIISGHFGEYREKGDELILKRCIYCDGGDNGKDKYTAAYNHRKKVYNCKRASCYDSDKNIWQIAKDFGFIQERKKYKRPKTKAKPLDNEWIKYFKSRGISKTTLDSAKVRLSESRAAFPYYENGECVMIKFRTLDKKIHRESGGKPILWGMDDCDMSKPLVIVEGEIDALTLKECGIQNAVSVPSGAKDLTWIELCYDWIGLFKKVIIWPDNDPDGKTLIDKVPPRIGEWKCSVVESKHKDANEHFLKDGKESVIRVINHSKEIPIEGIIDITDVKKREIPPEDIIKFGIRRIDDLINGSIMGAISIWSGKPGAGKSTMTNQIIIESLEQGHRACIYSKEIQADKLRSWIYKQLAGDHNIEDKEFNGFRGYSVKYDAWKKINNYCRGKLFLYDSKILPTSDDILSRFKNAYRKFGTRVFLIDNLAATGLEGRVDNPYEQQKEFVWKIKDFADAYNVHVHIVSHPRKIIGEIGLYDVCGSSNIVNFANNVYAIHRITEEDIRNDSSGKISGYSTLFKILKNREYGVMDESVGLNFRNKSKRFYGDEEHQGFKQYGWEEKAGDWF